MPMEVQIKTGNFKFEKMSLPFENKDFDFDTIKKFQKEDEVQESKGEKKAPKRKNSNDTIITHSIGDDNRSEKKASTIHDGQSFKLWKKTDSPSEKIDYRGLMD